MSSSQKKEMLDSTIKQLQTRFGEGTIMKLDERQKLSVPVIPSGILSIDIAVGVGGFPRGKIVEIFGLESSGKTTIALKAIAEAQKRGGVAAFIDAEHAIDPAYAEKLGVKLDELYISQPDSGEQALEIAETLIKTGQIDIVVIDSVAALVPKAEIDGNMGDSQIGLQARLMSQALRKITGSVNKSNTCVVFINQIRMKIGGYGNPETTTGGMALKFYSSLRLEVRKGEALKEKDTVLGYTAKVKVAKNKLAAPFKTAEFLVLFDRGPYNTSCIFEEGLKDEILERKGTFYYYGEEKIGQGKDNSYKYLEENPKLLKEIENKLRAKHNLPLDTATVAENNAEAPAKEEKKKTKKASKKVEEDEELL